MARAADNALRDDPAARRAATTRRTATATSSIEPVPSMTTQRSGSAAAWAWKPSMTAAWKAEGSASMRSRAAPRRWSATVAGTSSSTIRSGHTPPVAHCEMPRISSTGRPRPWPG
jgi:hypothetical protein